jgi:hypothetical protein
MTTYTVNVGATDVSAYIRQIEFWTKVLPVGIGRFLLTLDNTSGDLSDLFQTDDAVVINAGTSNVPFVGYVDQPNPQVKETIEAHSMRNFFLLGRDFGQDLMNKSVEHILYGKGDDIVDTLLAETNSLIKFASPHTAPELLHDSKGWTFLLDQLISIFEYLNYEGFVYWNTEPTLNMESVANAVSSGITLKSVANQTDNNIVKLLDHVEKDSIELRNVAIVFGPDVDDHITELNAADYAGLFSGNTVANYVYALEAIPTPRMPSLGGIKVVKNAGTDLGCKYTLPKNFVYHIDWSTLQNGKLTFQSYIHKTSGSPTMWYLYPRLKDVDGNVIRRTTYAGQYDSVWKLGEVPLGNFDDGWEFATSISPPFKWATITELQFCIIPGTTLTNVDFFILDLLKMPQPTYAVANHSGGVCPICGLTFPASTPKHFPVTRNDIWSQFELNAYAESVADKRDHALERLRLIADGEAGIIGGVWKWRPSYKVIVNAPVASISNEVFRMIDLHHIIGDPIGNEPKHTVELDMVPYNQVIDSQRWSYGTDGKIAMIRRLHDRLRWVERRQGYTP